MPMVNGMKFPYTDKGKKDAKKAAVSTMIRKRTGKGPKKAKNSFSGANSQMGSSY